MRRVILHPGETLDDHRHAGQRPEIRREAERAGPLAQGGIDVRQPAALEFGLAPRAPGATQRRPSALAPRAKPPHDTLATNAEPARDRALRVLAGGEQPGRHLPTYFHPMEISSQRHVSEHTAWYRTTKVDVTLLCKDQ